MNAMEDAVEEAVRSVFLVPPINMGRPKVSRGRDHGSIHGCETDKTHAGVMVMGLECWENNGKERGGGCSVEGTWFYVPEHQDSDVVVAPVVGWV
jgi:hypothetical protein